MSPPISVIVLGAGGFGRYYIDILARLNSRKLPKVPQIGRLVVTRTHIESAERLADSVRKTSSCAVEEVVGAKVSSLEDVCDLLQDHQPGLTAIAARDKDQGDTIHAPYAMQALNHGAVLCEKPFTNANGDGDSLKYFQKIRNSHNAGLFGLELPLAVTAKKMQNVKNLRTLLLNARKFEFIWHARDRGDHNIIDDLVLHPWSLIPPQFKATQMDVLDKGDQADIRFSLSSSSRREAATCRILLRAGGNYRAMMVDDLAIRFLNVDGLTKLVRVNGPLDASVAGQDKTVEGDDLLQVDNPLEKHIVAVLRHNPIVDLCRAFESQLFLEKIRGYRPYPDEPELKRP